MSAVGPRIWSHGRRRGKSPATGPRRTGRQPRRLARRRRSAPRTIAARTAQTLLTGRTATVRDRE